MYLFLFVDTLDEKYVSVDWLNALTLMQVILAPVRKCNTPGAALR